MSSCLFCSIVARRTPAWIVADDDQVVSFLDHRPLFRGHVLVVPRLHHETLPDLPPQDIAALFGWVQRMARAVEVAMQADGTFVAINNRISQSVPHLHVHVVPRRRKDGLKGFFWPRQKYESDTQALEIVDVIRLALSEGTVPVTPPKPSEPGQGNS